MDKDTFIAQNLFPKNDNIDKSRKLRLNVKPVDISTATRKTKLTLCVLGSWAIYMPPYNLARLSSLTREAGYYTRVFDFNVDSHYELKEANPALEDAWNGANYWWWMEPEYFKRIHPTYEPILRQYLDIIIADNPDIVGFSCYYTNIHATKWMIRELRQRCPNITILMGGPECAEGAFKKPKDVDYYFVGESEQNILEFLNNWEQGIKPASDKIGSLYSDTRIDIDSLPYPDYSDFDLSRYLAKNSICAEISRGCVAKCTYCTEVYYWKFRDRGALTVVDELEYQVKKYGISFVSFVDSLMNGNLKEFKKLCEEIIKRDLKINWWGYARADGRMDLSFYELMAEAGCQGFNYGIESGSDKVLKAINKKNTVAEINQNIIDSSMVGMKFSACWVIGAPGEDIEAFNHSLNLLWNHRARLYAVSPGPGLGDNFGSAYDDRDRFNLNPRNSPWLGGWWTKDLTNTRLHRHIRIKLMHIWLEICKESKGTLENVHRIGPQISDHYELVFENTSVVEDFIAYENFDYNVVSTEHNNFVNTVLNEPMSLFRLLWRSRGGFSMKIDFNQQLDNRDFSFAITPNTHTFDGTWYFKIDRAGNYLLEFKHSFVNNFKDVVGIDGFNTHVIQEGKWDLPTNVVAHQRTFYLNTPLSNNVAKKKLKIESCFSGISIEERQILQKISRMLKPKETLVELGSGLGGRAAIIADSNPNITVYSIENFQSGLARSQYEGSKSWIKEQLLDTASASKIPAEDALELLDDVSFHMDNGDIKQAWKSVTCKYSNIALVNSDYLFDSWEPAVNAVLVNVFEETTFNQCINFWNSKLLPGGKIIIPLYKPDTPVVLNKVNDFLSEGWASIVSEPQLICIQKPAP